MESTEINRGDIVDYLLPNLGVEILIKVVEKGGNANGVLLFAGFTMRTIPEQKHYRRQLLKTFDDDRIDDNEESDYKLQCTQCKEENEIARVDFERSSQ